jgi:ABC-type multidrug transport system fused ATPase/permease subunit
MRNVVRSLKLVLPVAPGKLFICFILSMPAAVIPAVLLYFERHLIDTVSTGITETSPVVRIVGIMIVFYAVMKLFDAIQNEYMEFGYFRTILLKLEAGIHQKLALLPLETYESAATFRKIDEGKRAVDFIAFTANTIILMTFMIISLAATGGLLASLHPLLIVFVVLVSMPVLLEKYRTSKEQALLVKSNTQSFREMKYALDLLLSPISKKEISLQGASGHISGMYLQSAKKANEQERKTNAKIAATGLFFAAVKAVFRISAMVLVTWLLLTDRITIGGFATALTSFALLSRTYTDMFGFLGNLSQMGMMAEPFFALMDADAGESGALRPEDEYIVV